MKFGKQFKFHIIPEWYEFYFDYNYLKLILKELDRINSSAVPNEKTPSPKMAHFSFKNEGIWDELIRRRAHSSLLTRSEEFQQQIDCGLTKIESSKIIALTDADEPNTVEDNKELFESLYRAKQAIVEEFFETKIEDLWGQFLRLKEKMEKRHSFVSNSLNSDMISFIGKKNKKVSAVNENSERDELGFAVSWKRALSNLYNLTSWLHSYCTINSIATQKLLKKFDKIFKRHHCENAAGNLRKEIQLLKYLNGVGEVIELRNKIQEFYAIHLTQKKSLSDAKSELEQRMAGHRPKDTKLMYLYCGMFLTLMAIFLVLKTLPKTTDRNDALAPFFPGFCFPLMLILLLVGIAVSIKIFRVFRINFIYIFDIDPERRLGYLEIARTALFLLVVWSLLLVFTQFSLSFSFAASKFYYFPMALSIFTIFFFVWPFHCFYSNLRLGILFTFLKNLVPLRKTLRFRDVLFYDVMVSLVRPFGDMTITACLLTCPECKQENVRGPCTRNLGVTLALWLLPFVVRFMQCLHFYFKTKLAWPHLGNALKYCFGIVMTLWSYLYATDTSYFFGFLVVNFVSNSYMLFWEIYVGWGLGRVKSQNILLRDKLVYPKSWYYCAIVANSILRFTWLIGIPSILKHIKTEYLHFLLTFLEILRRVMWAIFRVENENTTNPMKYRTILAIPELPLN